MRDLSMRRRCFTWIGLLAAIAPIAACTGTTAPPLPASHANAEATAYRLGLGDKVRISVFGEPDLSGEFQVSRSGTITVPLVGEVPANGQTAQELEVALTERYRSGYLRDPKISVEVYDFRPFFIMGEVEKPGRYPTQEGTTIVGAIAAAGGFTYRANTKYVFLRRAGDSQEYRVDPNSPIEVLPGDVIRVAERYF